MASLAAPMSFSLGLDSAEVCMEGNLEQDGEYEGQLKEISELEGQLKEKC